MRSFLSRQEASAPDRSHRATHNQFVPSTRPFLRDSPLFSVWLVIKRNHAGRRSTEKGASNASCDHPVSSTTAALASRYNDPVSNTEIEQVASADFPTRWGKFRIYGFRGLSTADGGQRTEEAVALVMGDVTSRPPLVRVHSQCLTGDVFHSLRCDCRQQLELSLSMIAEEGAGVLIYEQQEGRGIGLMAKLQAYELQDSGLDTVEANERLGFKADHRDFTLPAEILKALGVPRVRLLSNNPEKVEALERSDVRVVERVPCEVTPSPHAEEYLRTKKEKLGHLFTSS